MALKVYKHWSQFPMNNWRWPNFQPWEVACKDGENGTPKTLAINETAMDALQRLRDLMGVPIIVTSAYRTPSYNARVGGASGSKHKLAQAFDIIVTGHDPAKLYHMGKKAGFNAFGFYDRQGFMHMDVRSKKVTWGKKWFGNYVPEKEVVLPDLIPTPKPKIVHKPIPKVVNEAIEDADKEWWQSKTNFKWLLTGIAAPAMQFFTDPMVQKVLIVGVVVVAIYGIYERSRKAKLSRKAQAAIK